jgi:hypothetical protein
MRWVKHLTMAHKDPEVDAVLEKLGAVAYGAYWLIIEEIASAMEPGKDAPEAVRSVGKWAGICRVQPRVFRKIIAELGAHLVTVCETSDGRLKIAVPKILKYRDEYSKRSGYPPEQTQTRADIRAELAVEQLQTESPGPTRIPAQMSQSENPLQRIAVNASSPGTSKDSTDGLVPAPVPHEITRVIERSELTDDVDLMRRGLNAINRDRLGGKLSPADAGTAKNILSALREKRPGIDPDAAAQLLVGRLFRDGHRLQPAGWGLIVKLAREM